MRFKQFFKTYGPEVGIMGGLAGMWLATGLSIFATVKVVRKLDKAKEEKGDELTFKEKTKIIAPWFIAPLALAVGSTISIAAGTKAELARAAALTSLAKLAERTLDAQKEAEKKVVGEKKANEIETQALKELVTRDDGQRELQVFKIKNYDTIFCDPSLLGPFCFTGDWQTIRSRVNDIGVAMKRGEDTFTGKEFVTYAYQIDPDEFDKTLGFSRGMESFLNLDGYNYRPSWFSILESRGWNIYSNSPMPDISETTDETVCTDGSIVHFIRHNCEPKYDVR